MRKVADAADIYVLFFSAGAIFGQCWVIFGLFWVILGKFLGHFLVLIFWVKKLVGANFLRFCNSA